MLLENFTAHVEHLSQIMARLYGRKNNRMLYTVSKSLGIGIAYDLWAN